jgi:hypothetical protein
MPDFLENSMELKKSGGALEPTTRAAKTGGPPFATLPTPTAIIGQPPVRVTMPDDSTVIVTDATTDPDADPADYGYYDAGTGERMTNFTAPLLVEEVVEDGGAQEKILRFALEGEKVTGEFTLPAGDLDRDQALVAAVRNAGGVEARILCKPKELREAMLEQAAATPYQRRHVTRNFGWNQERSAYLFPSGGIDGAGFHPPSAEDWRVDLSRGKFAARLDLAPPPEDLGWWKSHLWHDLLGVNDRRVTLSLLGAVGAAVLFPALDGVNRFGLWLTGKTGTGKSFTAQLFQNFFGSFPPGKGYIPTWASTPNFLQAEGFYFKDALYLLDDYKKRLLTHPAPSSG